MPGDMILWSELLQQWVWRGVIKLPLIEMAQHELDLTVLRAVLENSRSYIPHQAIRFN